MWRLPNPKFIEQKDTKKMTLFPAVGPLSMSLFSSNKRVHNAEMIAATRSSSSKMVCPDMKRVAGVDRADGFDEDHNRSSKTSCSRSIADDEGATTCSEMLSQQPQNEVSLADRHRRVRFVDEVQGLPPQHLVTRIEFRPRTMADEKSSLYYNSKDYAFFALEDYYYQLEVLQKEKAGSPTTTWISLGRLLGL